MILELIKNKKFGPILNIMTLGAFNDNLFKNALILLVTYQAYTLLGLSITQMVALLSVVFISPFFFFSSLAGQLADKYSKSNLIKVLKVTELIIAILISIGFYFNMIEILIFSLFLLGTQSSFFGPIKYSILPDILDEDKIVSGNAMFQMGTFLAILLGTIGGGIVYNQGALATVMSVIICSLLGLYFSFKQSDIEANNPSLKIDKNPLKSTFKLMSSLKSQKSLLLSVLGISWFWFFGATLLALLPVYGKEILNVDSNVVTMFLAIFSVGIATGSFLSEKVNKGRLELGLIPLGSLGISLGLIFLYLNSFNSYSSEIQSITNFISSSTNVAILINLFVIALFGGMFIVPLVTFLQLRSKKEERARIIATNNIVNALFMVLSGVFIIIMQTLGFDILNIFLTVALMNIVVGVYITLLVPEFILRLSVVLISKFIYRIKVHNVENIPVEGAGIIVANHVSFIDWLLLAASIPRPVRFVMHYSFWKIPLIKILFKGAKVIPIAPKKDDEEIYNKAFEKIDATLADDELVCIFPEGKITKDGHLNDFKGGIDKILSKRNVPVIPVGINDMWGSFFSRKDGKALSNPKLIFKRYFKRINIVIGDIVENKNSQELHKEVSDIIDY